MAEPGDRFRIVIEEGAFSEQLNVAAEILETHVEDIMVGYEARLFAIESPLLADSEARKQVRAQARAVLAEVAATLRGREALSDAKHAGDHLSETIGASRASKGVHASESLRAVVAFSEAALSVVVEELPPSPTSRSEVAAVAIAIQKSMMARVTRAGIAYADYLLEKVHESHADERRRISRELHDRVAHSIMVIFRNLELYEAYVAKDPSKAQARLELAKQTAQEAFEVTRSLSSELRNSAAGGGLEVALSDLLSMIVPRGIRSWVAVKGDESLIPPQVRDELFLILREGIRNALRHSGAETIEVELDIAESNVKATVEDDGRGFDPAGEEATRAGGMGLVSMKERMSLLGGNVSLTSTPGEGTRVEIFLPLPRRSQY